MSDVKKFGKMGKHFCLPSSVMYRARNTMRMWREIRRMLGCEHQYYITAGRKICPFINSGLLDCRITAAQTKIYIFAVCAGPGFTMHSYLAYSETLLCEIERAGFSPVASAHIGISASVKALPSFSQLPLT